MVFQNAVSSAKCFKQGPETRCIFFMCTVDGSFLASGGAWSCADEK